MQADAVRKEKRIMSKMKELYEKVAADSTLQDKFFAIIKAAEEAWEEATNAKLTAFAKNAGFDVTLDEMRQFFKELAEYLTDHFTVNTYVVGHFYD